MSNHNDVVDVLIIGAGAGFLHPKARKALGLPH